MSGVMFDSMNWAAAGGLVRASLISWSMYCASFEGPWLETAVDSN